MKIIICCSSRDNKTGIDPRVDFFIHPVEKRNLLTELDVDMYE